MSRFFPLPQAGDIVWCRFPHRGISGPGPKARPALVIDTGQLAGEPAVEVAYGTSRKLDQLFPGEFVVAPADGDAFAASGLSLATKFDVSKSVFLPYDMNWFSIAPGSPCGPVPKLGILHPSLLRRAKAAYDDALRTTRR